MASIVGLLFLSTIAIGLLYGAGLMWGEHTHLSMVEYWRWWVVHLWVEGFFEVFAVAVISFLFVKLGLVRAALGDRQRAVRDHRVHGRRRARHLPSPVLGRHADRGARAGRVVLGAGSGAAGADRHSRRTRPGATAAPRRGWQRYRWPIMFFLAVSFWNLVGAGLFGFLINTPIALYYMQGLNLTPLHGHTALFGVYGMLGIGLMLFCLRGLRPTLEWNEDLLRSSFWALNIGLSLMALLALLPMGVLQLQAALEHGYWYARSADFMGR